MRKMLQWRITLVLITVALLPLLTSTESDSRLTHHLQRRATLKNSPMYYISTFLRTRKPYVPASEAISPLLRLPLEFMSNARPMDIVKTISKKQHTKPFKKYYHNSKMYHLPLKMIANGKPTKIYHMKPAAMGRMAAASRLAQMFLFKR